MYCFKCGYLLNEAAYYCSKCGVEVRDVTTVDQDDELKIVETQIETILTPKSTRSWISSTPLYILSWIALFGTIFSIILGSKEIAGQGGWALCFWCACVTAIMVKRRNSQRFALNWFLIGLIPIGFSLFFVLTFLKSFFLR